MESPIQNYRLKPSLKAQRDLKDIYEFNVLNATVERANKISADIYATYRLIELQPYMYPVEQRSRHVDSSVRKAVVHKTISIVYRVSGNNILVLRIFHNFQNPARLFK